MICFLSPLFMGDVLRRSPLYTSTVIALLALSLTGCALDIARLPNSGVEQSSARETAAKLLATSPSDSSSNTHLLDSDQSTIQPESGSTELPSSDGLLDVNAINAPVDALLYSLAEQSARQLEVVGQPVGRVTLKLVQATLPQILDQLSSQVPFSWQINAHHLQVWIGVDYQASYSVNYLNIHRTTLSSVGLATQVGTTNTDETNGYSIANSSQTNIQNTSEHSFWTSLEADLELLMRPLTASRVSAKPFSINREAGLLNVYANPKVHRAVKQYLAKLHDSIHRQVLIEATVVEVALSDRFEAGIDWQLLANGLTGLSAAQVLVGAPAVNAQTVNRVASPAGLVSLVQQSGIGDITATLSLLESFGNVKILSRPRIIALNNQSSVLKVVDNRVYFTAKIERTQSESVSDIVTETEIHTVPVGLVMNVTPQISRDGAVMLNVRPTLSRILGFVNDPNPELALANVQNGVPEIQVREMETMLRVQSGQVAVIGGLMQETSEKDNARLPGLGRIPLIKHLFSHQLSSSRQTELLVVLRPTLVPVKKVIHP